MKNIIIIILIASLPIIGYITPVHAKMATMDEAVKVANNWIALIINKNGSWGGSETAEIEEIQDLKRKGKKIGYFYKISPRGYIIVSLRKGLAPVKAYSTDSNLDPASDVGLADLIKGKMEKIIETIERRHGPLHAVGAQDLQDMLEINYRSAWDELIGSQGEKTSADFQSSIVKMNYQQGDILLSSSWHQGDPYNSDIPSPPAGDDCTATRCSVGCVATAAAQIMRYWNWPPWGKGTPYTDGYDWSNMLDSVTATSPQASIDAVAELNHEIGIAVNMDYCGSKDCQSGSTHSEMKDAYVDHFRYSTEAFITFRRDWSAVNWFNMLKALFNANRPVQYGILSHSIVGDGWQTIGSTNFYHMNYGWGITGEPCTDNPDVTGNADGRSDCTAWYALDALYQPDSDGTINDEEVIANIYPYRALGNWISGTYTKRSFVFRYFDRDATGHNAVFNAGQYLQFLPNVKVTNTSTTGGSFRFEGTSSLNTYMFSRGDTSAGVKITNGTIKVNQNGSIKFN